MKSERFVITDNVWEKIWRHLPGKATDRGVTAADNRLFLEAVLWRVRAGSPWRDLPPAFGNWNSVFQRFRRWAKKGVFERLFEELSAEPDFEYALIDWRHLIENYFAKIKEFRGIATRYDKTDISYAANWNLVATIIAMR